MEIILVLRVLLRRWYLFIIPVAIVAVFVVPDLVGTSPAISGGYTTEIRYSAAQVLEAIPNRDGDYQDVWLASALTIDALTAWVHTDTFRNEIATEVERQHGVDITANALGVASDNERAIGQLVMSYPDAGQLGFIADAAIEVLQKRAQDYFPQLGQQPAQVTVLDVPQVVAAPPPLTDRFEPLVKLALATFVGIGLAFLAEYFDNRLRDREAVERLGLPVIGTIPKY